MEQILSVENLSVVFHTRGGTVHAVNGISFLLRKGEIIGIVGESGCGKSVTANALMGLISCPPGEITTGRIVIDGQNIVGSSEKQLRKIRSNTVSMVFQDPMTSLNPVLTIGEQLSESFTVHRKLTKAEVAALSVNLLNLVGISAPESRLSQYPHQLSGGMRQRVMIAMALACNPRILIADEPTTALDVTIQAQILALFKNLNKQLETSIIFISHDLGIVAGLCDRVIVLYAGKVVEDADVNTIFHKTHHPYTRSLINSVPRLDKRQCKLASIQGQSPDLLFPPSGCSFLPRCKYAMNICRETPPLSKIGDTHYCRCWLTHKNSPYNPLDLF